MEQEIKLNNSRFFGCWDVHITLGSRRKCGWQFKKTCCIATDLQHVAIHVPGSKLPLFPYNRGWSSTQVGVYIPIIRIPIKGGMTIPNVATFDHGTLELGLFEKLPPKSKKAPWTTFLRSADGRDIGEGSGVITQCNCYSSRCIPFPIGIVSIVLGFLLHPVAVEHRVKKHGQNQNFSKGL